MKSDTRDDEYIRRERQEFPNRTVAVLVLVDAGERILLVKTHRLPNHWQPLGGGVKATDASPEAAVLRETKEEAGLALQAKEIRKMFDTDYDFGKGTVHFFVAPLVKGAALQFNEVEILSWRWFSLKSSTTVPVFPATKKCLAYLDRHGEILSETAQRARQ
jgi:8-oxo-dGTP pyrophosphatase MutT (NUDIX family)